MSRFTVLDVETANADYSSICQVGLVDFVDGVESSSWSTFVNPNSYFDPYNTSIHGIEASHVEGAPTFAELFQDLNARLGARVIVHHGHFDRTAFARSYDMFELPPIGCDWLDSTKIVRRVWTKYAYSGYGLSNLAKEFAIHFSHHDALDDARTAGQIVAMALAASNTSINDWLALVRQPICTPVSPTIKRDGNPEAPFFGEKIVFTGSLVVARADAADVAQKLGFDVQEGVTKKTTYVCVGLQDVSRLAGYAKSSKHRKAEELAKAGSDILGVTEYPRFEGLTCKRVAIQVTG